MGGPPEYPLLPGSERLGSEARFDRGAFFLGGVRNGAVLLGSLTLGNVTVPKNTGGGRLREEFAALDEKSESVRHRTFMPGQTIPWPVPIQIGEDWSLRFPDQPAVALLHSLGLDNADGQLTIDSNNVLLERLDSADIDYANGDRQVTYWGFTTSEAPLNHWRLRPALTTDRAVRGANFDKLSIEISGPLQGFTSTGQQIRKPSCRFAVAYRLNWFRLGERQQAIVDPTRETCISEQPLDRHPYTIIHKEVELYREATVGPLPMVMVSKPRRLQGGDDYYEANYDSNSGVVLINSFYATEGKHPPLQIVVDRLLGSAIFLSAASSPIPKLSRRAEAIAAGFNWAKNSKASIATFADVDDDQRITNESELFAEGLNIIRHQPTLFQERFEALGRPSRALARSIKNDITALIRLGLDLNGHREHLYQFVPTEIQQL